MRTKKKTRKEGKKEFYAANYSREKGEEEKFGGLLAAGEINHLFSN